MQISANKELRIARYRQKLFDRDQRSSMSSAKREAALILKESGVDYAIIAKSTGLSAEETARL